jgi:hypothetical protein
VAVTVTLNAALSGTQHQTFDVISDDDADTDVTIPHGLGVTPKSLRMISLDPVYFVSLWIETGRNSTQVTMRKSPAVGSGLGTAQLRVEIAKPHSIVD